VALKPQESSWLAVEKRSIKFRLVCKLAYDFVPKKGFRLT
jgi:hypothetical protein